MKTNKKQRKKRGLGALGPPWVPPSPLVFMVFFDFYWFSWIFLVRMAYRTESVKVTVVMLGGGLGDPRNPPHNTTTVTPKFAQ